MWACLINAMARVHTPSRVEEAWLAAWNTKRWHLLVYIGRELLEMLQGAVVR